MSETRKTVTAEEAQQWFEYFALRKDLALEYHRDGCWARKHLVGKVMKKHGLDVKAVWTRREDGMHPLIHNYRFHVSLWLVVKGRNGHLYPKMIDPVLFDRPVSPKAWVKKVNASSVHLFHVEEKPDPNRKDSDFIWFRDFVLPTNYTRDSYAKSALDAYAAKAAKEQLPLPVWVNRIRKEKSLALVPIPIFPA